MKTCCARLAISFIPVTDPLAFTCNFCGATWHRSEYLTGWIPGPLP